MGRGMLTTPVTNAALTWLGREITQDELRMMPYIQYCVMNDQNIDPNKIKANEREILSTWRALGYITGGASDLQITRHFWDSINAILWHGYVDY